MAEKTGDFWFNKNGEKVHVGLIRQDEQLKDSLVEELCGKAKDASNELAKFKAYAFDEVEAYYSTLREKFNLDAKEKSKKGNLSLENYSATAKVTINVADRISFDEKLSIAKEVIDEYLHEVTADSSADVKTLISKAFEVDKKGDINAKKILALKAYEISHPKWIKAMGIIDEATEIVSSKNYIRFYTRTTNQEEYKQVSLDLSSVTAKREEEEKEQ